MKRQRILNTLYKTALWSAAPSFVLYSCSRALNRIPAEANWAGNHGPWWDTWQGVVVVLGVAFLVLLFVASMFYLVGTLLSIRSYSGNRNHLLLSALALPIFIAAIAIEQIWVMMWTVD